MSNAADKAMYAYYQRDPDALRRYVEALEQRMPGHDYYLPEATARVIEQCMKRLAEAGGPAELRIAKKRIDGVWSFDVSLNVGPVPEE